MHNAIGRRSILQGAMIGLAGVVAGCASKAVPVSATSSTVPNGVLGAQLYTVRDLFRADWRGTLRALAAIGYRDVEFISYQGNDLKEMRDELDALGMESNSTHVSADDAANRMEQRIEQALQMRHKLMVVPYLRPDQRTAQHYRDLAGTLNRAGALAREAGLTLGYHNHDFEFENVDGLDGVLPFDFLLANTDPGLVKIEIDFFWARKAKADPLAYFARDPGRYVACHLKDFRDGQMVPVGEGTIDFAAMFDAAETAGLQYFYVEHDNPADPMASLRKSYANLLAAP